MRVNVRSHARLACRRRPGGRTLWNVGSDGQGDVCSGGTPTYAGTSCMDGLHTGTMHTGMPL